MASDEPDVRLEGWVVKWMVWAVLAAAALPGAILSASLTLPWSVVAIVGDLGMVVYPALRAKRISVAIGPRSVTVVNYFKQYELSWSEIQRIRVGGGSMLEEGVSRGIWFDLRSDRRILCQASTGYRPWTVTVLHVLRPHAEQWDIPIIDEPG